MALSSHQHCRTCIQHLISIDMKDKSLGPFHIFSCKTIPFKVKTSCVFIGSNHGVITGGIQAEFTHGPTGIPHIGSLQVLYAHYLGGGGGSGCGGGNAGGGGGASGGECGRSGGGGG